jgi:hypothetical protein
MLLNDYLLEFLKLLDRQTCNFCECICRQIAKKISVERWVLDKPRLTVKQPIDRPPKLNDITEVAVRPTP